MSLVPYTNTYTDTDGSIADSGDIVDEFDRVASFINAWVDSYETIGAIIVNEYNVGGDGTVDVSPSLGFVQVIKTSAGVTEIDINIKARVDGDPYRIYLNLRFGAKTTTFTVNAPSGQSHVFGLNQSPYSPSQIVNKGWYAASVIVTYGTGATHIQVFANNSETEPPTIDDILQEIAV